MVRIGGEQKGHTLKVDGLESAVAETNTHGGTGNAHRGRDGERVMRKDKNRESGTHFHRAATARRVIGDLVPHY
jgi:hypothetical protein